MKKRRKVIILTIWLLWLRRISQIIFDVFYSTNKDNYLWIQHGQWVNSITSSWWYEEQHIDLFTKSKPIDYLPSQIWQFQNQCKYKEGNCVAIIGQDALSSFHWVSAIQYIAREVDTSNPSDITNRFGLLSDSKPKWFYPYILLQYLGMPSKESPDQEHSQIARTNTIRLWEKWIQYFCDEDMITKIDTLTYSEFNQALEEKNTEYRYPCREGGELAHTLAFNYFYYLGDAISSIKYYKVASFHDDVPVITTSMPAIIEGKEGNNKISAYLRYDKFYNAATKLENKELNPDEIASLESNVAKALQKMVSEYALYLLSQATEQAKIEWKEESCYTTIDCLQQQWYLTTAIENILQTCITNTIDCHIIAIAEEHKRIQSHGKLIYPEEEQHNITYIWDTQQDIRTIGISNQ